MPTFFIDPRVWVVMVLAFVLGFATGGAMGYWRGDVAGTNSERTTWQNKEIERRIAEATAFGQRVHDNEIKQAADAANNLKDAQEHEQALNTVNTERDRLRAGNASLRISAAVCRGHAATGQAGSERRPADADPGTLALPAQVASDLFDLAAEADAVTEQARAMQKRLREDSGP